MPGKVAGHRIKGCPGWTGIEMEIELIGGAIGIVGFDFELESCTSMDGLVRNSRDHRREIGDGWDLDEDWFANTDAGRGGSPDALTETVGLPVLQVKNIALGCGIIAIELGSFAGRQAGNLFVGSRGGSLTSDEHVLTVG